MVISGSSREGGLSNHVFDYKIFLAPSANLMTSQSAACNIVLTGSNDTSASSLAVTQKSIPYAESHCWSSGYGSEGYLIQWSTGEDA